MEQVYLETTIQSYLVSKESRDIIVLGHKELTKEWWLKNKNKYELFVSEIVIDEISQGNPDLIKERLEIIKEIKALKLTNEIENIASKYMEFFNFPDKLVRDIYHVSYCVFYNIDFLLTWNCKHIANAHFKIQLEKLNNKLKLYTPMICTPEELLY